MADTVINSFHISCFIKAEDEPKFRELIPPALEQLRADPDLIFLHVFRSEVPGEPGVVCFKWVENWKRDLQWLSTVHMNKEWLQEFRKAAEPFFVKPQVVEVHQSLGPEFVISKDGEN